MAGLRDLTAVVGQAGGVLRDVVALPGRAVGGLWAIPASLEGMSGVTGAVDDLRSELVGLRGDLASMPADSRRLADDVEIVHETLGTLSAELLGIKASVAPVHDDLARVEAGLVALSSQLAAVLPKIDELAGSLDGMRAALSEQLDGLRTDLTALPFVSKT
jgi:ABC-type transporter Mla subunit MlaD